MRIKDIDIRLDFVIRNKDFLKSGVFVNEFPVSSKNICDFAVIRDDYNFGFEIKSESDNLLRLPKQMKSYSLFFDYIYLVCFENHFEEARDILSQLKLNHVGLIKVSNSDKLEYTNIREATVNKHVNKYFLANKIKQDRLPIYLPEHKKPNTKSLAERLSLEKLKKVLKYELNKLNAFKCPSCSSNLIKTSSYWTEEVKKDYIQKDKKFIKVDFLYSKRIHCKECFECRKKFNERIDEVKRKQLK